MSFVNNKIIVFLVILCIILFPVSSYADANIIHNVEKGPVPYGAKAYSFLSEQIIDESIGKIVTFGHYEQDNNLTNGKEPVEWILLEKDEKDNSATLISLYLIDCLRFDGFSRYVTWETCSLREYMNNTMFNDLFNEEEKKCIKETALQNIPSPFLEGESSGNPTLDYIYIPDILDIMVHFSNRNFVGDAFFQELLRPNMMRSAMATPYAISRGLRTTSANHDYPLRGNYFLRTIGKTGHRKWYGDVYADFYVSYITELGEYKPEGTGVDSVDDGIRPMIKVYF